MPTLNPQRQQDAINFGRAQRRVLDSFGRGGLGSGLFRRPVDNMLLPVTIITPTISSNLIALLDMLENPDNLNPDIQKPTELPLHKVTLNDQHYLQRFSQIEAGLNVYNLRTWEKIQKLRFNLGFNCIPKVPPNQARLSTMPVILFPTSEDQTTLEAAKKNRAKVIESQGSTCSPPKDGTPSLMTTSPQSSLIQLHITQKPITRSDNEADEITKDLIEKFTKPRDPTLPYEPDFHHLEVNLNSRRDLHKLVLIITIKTIQRTRLARDFCRAIDTYFDCVGSRLMRPLAVNNMFDISPWTTHRQLALDTMKRKIEQKREFKLAKKFNAMEAVKEFASRPCEKTFNALKDHSDALLDKSHSIFFHKLLLEAIKGSPAPASITLFSSAMDKLRAWLNMSRRTYPETYPRIVDTINRHSALEQYNILLTLHDYVKEPSVEKFSSIQAHQKDILRQFRYFWPILEKIAKADFHADRCGKDLLGQQKKLLEYWLGDPQHREPFRTFHASHRSIRDYREKHYIPFSPNRRRSDPAKPSPKAARPLRRSSSAREISLPKVTLISGSVP